MNINMNMTPTTIPRPAIHGPSSPTEGTPPRSLEELQRSYGFRHTPFELTDKANSLHVRATTQSLENELEQTAALRSVLLLTGVPGSGKSTQIKAWQAKADPKRHRIILVTQSSLTGSGVLETLLHKLGQQPRMKRSTNLMMLERSLEEHSPTNIVLVLDDAQNYLGHNLEEIRLLLGVGGRHRSSLALMLLGDEHLLGMLRLSAQRALLSRVSSHIELVPLSLEETAPYLNWHVKQAGVERELYTEAAHELLYAASGGNPRLLNHLARASWLRAATEGSIQVEAPHVNAAVKQIPSVRAIVEGGSKPSRR